MQLFPFQKEGIKFLEKRKGRALIADEMGLGKTVQALGWLKLHPEKLPALIVCPSVAKGVWVSTSEAWLPKKKIFLGEGQKPFLPSNDTDLFIINYDILTYWKETLGEIPFQTLILDECHYIKNRKAKRTKAVQKLAKKIPHLIALSGTPFLNRPMEGYTVFKLLEPKLFSTWFEFGLRYCAGKRTRFGWDFSGASNIEELHQKLKPIMLRRTKEEVMKELPKKMKTIIPVYLPQSDEKEYKKAEEDIISFLVEQDQKEKARKAKYAETLVKIALLRQLAAKKKLKQCIEWIRNFLEETDEKLVVFAYHRDILKELQKTFPKISIVVDGSTTSHQRRVAQKTFQENKKIRLFLGNIKAAGVAITLTAASTVVFVELPWTPGELVQAEDRCHRIGQKKVVNIYYFIAVSTIEEKIIKLLDRKKATIKKIVEGKTIENKDLLTELLTELKKQKSKGGK